MYIFLEQVIAKKKFLPAGGLWLFFISPGRWIGNEQLGLMNCLHRNEIILSRETMLLGSYWKSLAEIPIKKGLAFSSIKYTQFPLKVHSKVWYNFWHLKALLKKMKNAFYFTLKALFVLKTFKFLSWLLCSYKKTVWLERSR